MKNLIIITTKAPYLPGSKSDKILFKEESCYHFEPDEALALFNPYRDSSSKIYRLKDERLVFATSCLQKEGDVLSKEKRAGFIPTLFNQVVASLSDNEKTQVSKVFVIAHGYDLAESDLGFKQVFRPEMLKKMSFPDKDLVEGDLSISNEESKKIGVFFFSFSHVSGRHAFYDVLARYEAVFGKNAPVDSTISRLVRFECGDAPENDWMQEWATPDQSLFDGLTFEYYHVRDKKIQKLTDGVLADSWVSKAQALFPTVAKKGNRVKVVFVSLTQLVAHNNTYTTFLNHFFETYLRDQKIGEEPCPTLFVGCKDIMDDENLAAKEGLRLDRRYRFLDSSIWFRYVALEKLETFSSALNTFQWAYYHLFYEKNVCLEHLELHTRLFDNSYLKPYGDGHALNVYPFVFHSESKMERAYVELFKKKFEGKNLKWNFLLVDDYASLELRKGAERDAEHDSEHSKGIIIKKLIDNPPCIPNNEPNNHSLVEENAFWCATSVPEAIKEYFDTPTLAAQKTPDIILLDYLFSYPRDKQHYGTALLEAIAEGKTIRKSRSVSQKYWIHPISVFNEAMYSEMQESSYQHFEPQWNLARGADPINTPHLFRRSLLEFMDVQAELLLFDQEELWEFLTNQGIDNNLSNGSGRLDRKQKILLNTFRNFLEQFSADEGVDSMSAIGESAKKYMRNQDPYIGILRDHLRQILFLFAYTSGFDFPAIQREFSQIDAIYAAYYRKKISEPNNEPHLEAVKKVMDVLAEWVYSTAPKYNSPNA